MVYYRDNWDFFSHFRPTLANISKRCTLCSKHTHFTDARRPSGALGSIYYTRYTQCNITRYCLECIISNYTTVVNDSIQKCSISPPAKSNNIVGECDQCKNITVTNAYHIVTDEIDPQDPEVFKLNTTIVCASCACSILTSDLTTHSEKLKLLIEDNMKYFVERLPFSRFVKSI